jgi:hypothetical protein
VTETGAVDDARRVGSMIGDSLCIQRAAVMS